MKKIFALLFFTTLVVTVSSQEIYNYRLLFDKFDDKLEQRCIKTIVTNTDSTIVFETKGKPSITYYKLSFLSNGEISDYIHGSKDKPDNLVYDVYGIETGYLCINKNGIEYMKKCLNDSILIEYEHLQEFMYDVIFRTITTQYTGSYINKLCWIRDYKTCSREIFTRELY